MITCFEFPLKNEKYWVWSAATAILCYYNKNFIYN